MLVTDQTLINTNFYYDFFALPTYLEILKRKLRIAVIHGGDSALEGAVIYKTHNSRSTKTYELVAWDIARTLQELGFQHIFVMSDDMTLPEQLKKDGIHLAWLNTGGVQGYDPVCQTPALLEMLGVPYIGQNPLNSSTLDNKHYFKRQMEALGLKTAPFMTWHLSQGRFQPYQNDRFAATFGDYSGPFLLKPVSGRASLNIHFVEKVEGLPLAVSALHRETRNTVQIETYLPGREFCVSVCGSLLYSRGQFLRKSKPFAFSALERVMDADELIFTSMDKKAIASDRVRIISDEEAEIKQELIDVAQRVYQELNLSTLVRLDLRADDLGVLHILEANPKPDLKRPQDNVTNLVSLGLSEYGMSYKDLILSLLADRLDYLLTHHGEIIFHITDLLA